MYTHVSNNWLRTDSLEYVYSNMTIQRW
jgi:hypothetical protein